MSLGGQKDKNRCQHRKYQSLDKTDKKLQAVKGNGGNCRDQKRDNRQKHGTSKNVAEKSERKGDDFGKFRNALDKADKKLNWPFEINEPFDVFKA